MKLMLITYRAIFVAFVVGRALDQTTPPSIDHSTFAPNVSAPHPLLYEFPHTGPQPQELSQGALNADPVDSDAAYFKAQCSGQKLFQAMTTDADTADRFIYPVTSQFDGNMVNELRAWGWNDLGAWVTHCDFQEHITIRTALTALGIDPRSEDHGGLTQCIYAVHENGPTVIRDPNGNIPPIFQQYYIDPRGWTLRVTGAVANMGINPDSGIVYFLSRRAPLKAAELLWTDRIQNPITSLDLPWLRSSSDIAWGFWNRATVRKLQLKNIHYLMACDIVNEETLEIIKRALKKHKELQPPSEHPEDPDSDKGDGVKNWPGTTFILNGDDPGMALLGSPNGVGAGYFLAQHKAQLGGNKVISKITVFGADVPNLLFWVADKPEEEEPEESVDSNDSPGKSPNGHVENRVVNRSKDGKQILREYVFRAKL